MRKILTTIFLFIGFFVSAQVVTQDIVYATGVNIWERDTARAYFPGEYTDSVTKRYPLIIFFHGSGEGSTDYNSSLLESTGLPQLIAGGQVPQGVAPDGKTYKFIVVCPQSANGATLGIFNHPEVFKPFLDKLFTDYRIDTTRVYATGLSLGSESAVGMSVAQPGRLAAIYPISFTGYLNQPPDRDSTPLIGKNYHTGLWTVVGSNDTNINSVNPFALSQDLVDQYNSLSPSPVGTRTEIAGQGHSAGTWNTAYDTAWRDNVNNTSGKNMYEWMLQYQQNGTITYTSPKAEVKVYVYTSGTPSSVTVTPATQKYNKNWVFMLSVDDGPDNGWSIYNMSRKYSYTDGTSMKRINYRAEMAVNSRNSYNCNLILEDGYPNQITLPQLAEMVKGGWMLSNHGAYHFDSTITLQPGWENACWFPQKTNITWNEQYFHKKMGELGAPISIRTWTTPSSDQGYGPDLEEYGYLAASSQSVTDGYPVIDAGGPVTIPAIDGNFKVYKRNFSDQWNIDWDAWIKGYIDGMVSGSNSTTKKMFRIGTHTNPTSLPFYDTAFAYLQSKGDDGWITSLQEFEEYHEIKRIVEPTKTVNTNGNVTVITYDFSGVPDKNVFRDMSLLVDVTGATIQSVYVTGVDDYTYNTSTGLVNIYSKKRIGYQRPYGSPRITDTLPIDPSMVYIDAYETVGKKTDYLVNASDTGYNLGGGLYAKDTVDIYIEPPHNWNVKLTKVRMYDANGDALNNPALFYGVKRYTGESVQLATFDGSDYNAWKETVVSDTSTFDRFYLRKLHVNSGTYSRTMPTKIKLIGEYNRDTLYYPSYIINEKPKFKREVGANSYWYLTGNAANMTEQATGFIDKHWKMNRIRYYFDMCQHITDGDSTWFNYYDSVFKWMHDKGVEVNVALKSMPVHWVHANYPETINGHTIWTDTANGGSCLNVLVPAPWGGDWTDPNSYVSIAKYCFQIAARYGRNSNIDESLRKSNTPEYWYQNKDASVWGLGYVQYMSAGNENDKAWMGDYRWLTQSGAELAAMMSACYDGNKGAMGVGVGIKTADPTMKVLPPAFTRAGSDDILRAARQWVIANRGYRADGITPDWPWDITDFHNYSSDADYVDDGDGIHSQTTGKRFEVSNGYSQVDTVLTFSARYMNSMPATITETGWDTRDTIINSVHTGTVQNAGFITGKTVYETQADWSASMALLSWAKGIHSIDFYEMFDNIPFNWYNDIFGSTGLFWSKEQGIYSGSPGEVVNKQAANVLIQLRKLLDNYTVDSVFINTTDSVWKIKASYLDSIKYIVWVGRESNATASVSLSIAEGVRYNLDYNSENYNYSQISTGTNYTFTATETPTIFLVGQQAEYIPPEGNRYRRKAGYKGGILIPRRY